MLATFVKTIDLEAESADPAGHAQTLITEVHKLVTDSFGGAGFTVTTEVAVGNVPYAVRLRRGGFQGFLACRLTEDVVIEPGRSRRKPLLQIEVRREHQEFAAARLSTAMMPKRLAVVGGLVVGVPLAVLAGWVSYQVRGRPSRFLIAVGLACGLSLGSGCGYALAQVRRQRALQAAADDLEYQAADASWTGFIEVLEQWLARHRLYAVSV